jgi:dihydroorotase
VIEFIWNRARELNLINIYPAGAITVGQKGKQLAELNELKASGAIAVTDDGVDVQDENVLRRAMQYAKTCGILLMSHCETDALTAGGVMHEGWVSTQLGLPGVPAESEDLAVRKNIMLAEMCGARLHLLHNSSAGAVLAIRDAKRRGAAHITAEVSVQHFALTDEECFGYNTSAKMYPPLRSREHVEAIIEGIRDDVFDAFTTDHAPHTEPEKLVAFQDANFGSTGLETSFAVMNTYLVKAGHISFSKGISKMSFEPAKILGIPKGTLSEGADADIAVFDTGLEWTVDASKGFSKGRNCIFNGKRLTGRASCTIAGGRILYRDGRIVRGA